jgi:hypothetical protein
MAQTVHLIYHRIPHDQIKDMHEVVGVVLTGWEDADRIVDALNERNPTKGFSWQKDYWKKGDVDVITIDDVERLTSS